MCIIFQMKECIYNLNDFTPYLFPVMILPSLLVCLYPIEHTNSYVVWKKYSQKITFVPKYPKIIDQCQINLCVVWRYHVGRSRKGYVHQLANLHVLNMKGVGVISNSPDLGSDFCGAPLIFQQCGES